MESKPPSPMSKPSPLEITILIVDDCGDDRLFYCHCLRSPDGAGYSELDPYHFLEADTLETGIRLWQAQQPDVVLLAMDLADGSGLEFLAYVQERYPNQTLPIICLSNRGEPEAIVQAVKLGASDYLIKDKISSSVLQRIVKTTLQQWRLSQRIHQFQERESLASQIAERIRRAFDLQSILNTCVEGVQKLLNNDRVVIYRFNADMSGQVVAEQVVQPWRAILDQQVTDTCFQQTSGGDYRTGRIFHASDILQAGLTDCHIQLLQGFQVRANLVVPILLQPSSSLSPILWGLLIAHQCEAPRVWDSSEINLLQQIATQLAIAVQQSKANQQLNQQLQELNQWRTRYELAERASGQMIYEYYFTHDSVLWSPNVEQILGYTKSQLPQRLSDWLALLHPQDRPLFLAEMKHATEAHQGFHLEYRLRHQQGHYLWLEDRNQWLYDDQGQPVGVIGMIADITQRKEMEARLTAKENQFRQLAIAQPGTLYTLLRRLDGSYTFTYLSPQAEELFEVAIESALANAELILQQIHPEDVAGYVQAVEESLAHLSLFCQEFRWVSPSGRLKWIQANSSPETLPTGEVAWHGITLEITDRKQQEAQLKESESRFRQLAENIRQVFYLTDQTKGKLLYISPSYETIWQRSCESLYAQPASYIDAVMEADHPVVIQAYQDQLQGHNTEIEYRIVRPDGSVRWILDRTFVVQAAQGKGRVCGIAEDITQRKQTEIALQQETAFNQLIAEISHRLVDVNADNLPAETQRMLERIGQLTQADSCALFRLDFENQVMVMEQEWVPPDRRAYQAEAQALPFAVFPWSVSLIQSQQICYVSDMEQAPPSAVVDVAHWQQFGIKATLGIPFIQQSTVIGFLGVASSTQPMDWTPEAIRLLTILTQTLANARERVQTATELQVTSTRLQQAQRIAQIGNWELNHSTGDLYWSEEVFRIFELDPQVFLPSYEAFLVIIHPEDREALSRAYAQHLQDGFPYGVNHRLQLPDGRIKYLQEQCETVFSESGQPLISTGTVQDVTPLKQIENQLQALNEDLEHQVRQRTQEIWDFQLALDESALVAITDAQGVITYVNDRFCEISGYSRAELLGQTHRLISSGEHSPSFFHNLWQTIRAGQIWRGEICNLTKKGDRYWLAGTIVPFLDASRQPYQYLAIRFDITDRKQAEMQLQTLSNRLSIALDAGEIGCWEWNIVDNALTWDKRMFELYGHPPTTERVPYTIWSEGVYEPDRAATETLLHQTVAGKTEFSTEFRVLHPNGAIAFIKAYGLVIRDQAGQPQKMIGVNFDITQQKTAELALRHQAEKETLLRQISQRIRQTLDLSTTFNTACQEIRDFLRVDRVAIFQFYPDSGYDDGEFVAESLNEGFSSVLAIPVHDHCFGEGYSLSYIQGHFQAVEDVLNSDLQDCHKAVLAQFQIRANLVMPLLQGQVLWGLLCIHTCTAPRRWQPQEIELVQQTSQQLAIAIQQANLYDQIQRELAVRQQAEALIREELQRQQGFSEIIQAIRSSFDLTEILAQVTALVKTVFEGDRVIVFCLYADGRSQILEEAVAPDLPHLKDMQWQDEVWSQEILDCYWQGNPRIVPDVMQDPWTDCLREYSLAGQIQSKMVAPILLEVTDPEAHRWLAPDNTNKLWGILVVHACRGKRQWQTREAQLLQQIANQLAIAIQQAHLFQQLTASNQELVRSNEALAKATRLKDEFLANMSHELRTPLTSILGMSEALQEKTFGEINSRQDKALKQIEKSGRHLLDLINDILDFAKIEAGKLELDLRPVNLTQICHDSLTMMQQLAEAKNIQLQKQIDLPLSLLTLDERRAFQCLLNLLSNAVKFTPQGGTVTLTLTLDKEEVAIAVCDTGIGIASEHFDKLFRPFEQIDSRLSRQYEGTGLGLALVKRIMEAHQGRVTVTSHLGQGSCFTLYFPYRPTSAPQSLSLPTITPETLLRTATKQPVILLADDNEVNRDTLHDYLTQKGYRLVIATDGEEALALAQSCHPDLILMDVQMPKLNGLMAIAQIRSTPEIAQVPIIALTALAMPGDQERCLAAGANEYLTKPIRFRLLTKTMDQLLEKFP